MNYKCFVIISLLLSCNTDADTVLKSNPYLILKNMIGWFELYIQIPNVCVSLFTLSSANNKEPIC